jgi:hypothetical protein
MERQTNTNILFLDACRDNPLARNLARAMGTRSSEISRGLAVIESGIGTLISFSTQPGNVASDGAGRNSPFTGPLVKHISTSDDDLSAILIAVRNDVMKETQRKQVPWEHSALTGRFYFGVGAQENPAPRTQTRLSEAAEAWDRTKDTTSIAVLEAFILRYKDTFYAELARARIEESKKHQVAIAPPPPEPSPPPAATNTEDTKRRNEQQRKSFNNMIANALKNAPEEEHRALKNAPSAAAIVQPPSSCIEVMVAGETRCLKPKDTFRGGRAGGQLYHGVTGKRAGTHALGGPETREDR